MSEEVLTSNGHFDTDMQSIVLDSAIHGSDGAVPFYRGELYLSNGELDEVNNILSNVASNFIKPVLVQVKSPPLVPVVPVSVFPASLTNLLPSRATRGSVPAYTAPVRGGKARVTEPVSEIVSTVPVVEIAAVPVLDSDVSANTDKIRSVIGEIWRCLIVDSDYVCLDQVPEGLDPLPPVTLSGITNRLSMYNDHFQFSHDVIEMCMYWLRGPPMVPQYMASLKLLRTFTDVSIAKVPIISNEDYYVGPSESFTPTPPVAAASPKFARKVRKIDDTVSSSTDLKSIEEQVAMLTKHVLGLGAPSRVSATPSSDPKLTPEEVGRLESDLMKLSPEDIDHIVGNILKDEPSVRVDDESYELDVGALPAFRQRTLRRFVTRRLNAKDPAHGANKIKQMLRDDDLAKASEDMAERLLSSAPLEDGPERARASEKDRQREDEARRLWQLAHGDDMED